MKRGYFWMTVLIGLFAAGLYVQYHIIGARVEGWLIKFGYTVPDGYSPPALIIGFVIWLGFFTVLTKRWDTESNYPYDYEGEQPFWLILLSGALGFLYSFGVSYAFDVLGTTPFTWLCGSMDGIALLCILIRIYAWYSAQAHHADLAKIKNDLEKATKEYQSNEAIS